MAYGTMEEEVDRYKKLLGDWKQASKPGAPRPGSPTPQPSAPGRPEESRARMAPVGAAHAPDSPYASGSILCLNDEELVIYRRPVAGKPLDMVYSLLADGTVKIDAVDFSQQRVEEIGQLPPAELKGLQNEMRWSRALLAPHCFYPEDSERIPDPGAAVAAAPRPAPASASSTSPLVGKSQVPQDTLDSALRQESAVRIVEEPQTPGKIKIRRGQTVSIKFGDRAWDAVYWGRDARGSVVAHNTHNHWSLMHLDLAKYKETLVISPEPDPLLIEQISRDLSTGARELKATE